MLIKVLVLVDMNRTVLSGRRSGLSFHPNVFAIVHRLKVLETSGIVRIVAILLSVNALTFLFLAVQVAMITLLTLMPFVQRPQLQLRVQRQRQRQRQPADPQQQPPPRPHTLLSIAEVRAMKTRKMLALVELLIYQFPLVRPTVRIL